MFSVNRIESSPEPSWLAEKDRPAAPDNANSFIKPARFTIRPPRTVYQIILIESINAEKLLYVFFRKKSTFTAKNFLQGEKKVAGGRFPVFNLQSAVGSWQKRNSALTVYDWVHGASFLVGSLNNRCLPLMFFKKRILQTKKIQLPARVYKAPAGTGFLFIDSCHKKVSLKKTGKKLPVAGGQWPVSDLILKIGKKEVGIKKTQKKLPVAGSQWPVAGLQSAIENKEDRHKKEVRHKKRQKTQKNLKKACKGPIYFEDTVPRIDFSHLAILTPNKGKTVRGTVFLQTKPAFVVKKNRSPLKRAKKKLSFYLTPFKANLEKVSACETGFKVHQPMRLFPVSRQHVPESPPGFIVVFNVHDDLSLSKERVNQTTSNDQGFNEYLNLLKKSERFRRPARVPKTMAGTGSLLLKKKRKSNFSPRRHEGHEGKKKRRS